MSCRSLSSEGFSLFIWSLILCSRSPGFKFPLKSSLSSCREARAAVNLSLGLVRVIFRCALSEKLLSFLSPEERLLSSWSRGASPWETAGSILWVRSSPSRSIPWGSWPRRNIFLSFCELTDINDRLLSASSFAFSNSV